MAQAGARVIVADVTDDPCKARVAELKKLGGKADYCLVDVTSRQSIENLLAKSIDLAGRVHILVNCAGVNAGTNFLDATDADWDRILTINLRGVFQSCQVFGRHMIEQGGGSIVNIGSVTSHLPLSRVFAYAASKAGVLNLSRNIAHDFGQKGVRVNVICPGFFPAEQNRKLLTKERVESIMSHTPMNRYGEPEELVGALVAIGLAQGRQFHHRRPHQRRRRLHRRVVVKPCHLSGHRPKDGRERARVRAFIAKIVD